MLHDAVGHPLTGPDRLEVPLASLSVPMSLLRRDGMRPRSAGGRPLSRGSGLTRVPLLGDSRAMSVIRTPEERFRDPAGDAVGREIAAFLANDDGRR